VQARFSRIPKEKGLAVAVWVAMLVLVHTARAESLYSPETYRDLAADHRARKVGDNITVLIYESATATSRADSSASRSSKLEGSATDLHNTIGGNVAIDNDFQGGGQERRTGEVIARVSVTVVDIADNGELRVKGEQRIALNSESQRIFVEGRLRPQDIGPDNTVLSSRLSDAHIEFKGRGLLSSRQKPGLLLRFFQWLL
jgi:flagellar L-ring protein precursor FlgH